MFKKLRNKIIIITMTITTAVLLVAGSSIMLFSSTLRPEPKPFTGPAFFDAPDNNQDIKEYIKNDRKEGSSRLLATLLSVGLTIEVIVFLISYYLSEKIVAPVKESYNKQKLFIANASHELKTPLAVIEANMEAMEVAKGSEEWKNNIEHEITHANKLVLDLLQLAKMDAGGIAKSPSEEVELYSLINEQVEIFKPKFSGKITFSKKIKETKKLLPKQDFLQVLDILLDNATKYGDKKITVTLNQNEVMVINDGATVAKQDQEKIFDRFYQTDKTREGSGLGLAIAKAICEQNGWQITCEGDKKSLSLSCVFRFVSASPGIIWVYWNKNGTP